MEKSFLAYAKRTDSHGQTLKIGESQRKDGRYSYSWTNNRGERKGIYATSLLELRQKEKKLIQDLEDGLEPGVAERITVNQIWNKYIAQKKSLKVTTREGYIYTYDHFVRDSFGNMKISKVKYSHVKKFYNELLENGLSIATIDNVNTVLHPAFQMAVRDDLIRVNPTEGVMNEIKRDHAGWKKRRHTFCTRLCENESNIKVIQSIMGHSDIQTTLDIYADCTADKKQEVMESLEGKIIIR